MEGFITFLLAVTFLIMAAWLAVTIGEGAGKLALSIPKFAKKAAKTGIKAAWKGTGVPGAVKQRWADVMGQRRARAEARRERLMGGKTLSNKLVGEGVDKLKAKDTKAKDALEFANKGYGADGEKLNEFDRIASYIHGAPAIGDDYDALQVAKNHMRRLGASEKNIAQFEGAARNSNPLVLYDLKNEDLTRRAEEYGRLEADYKEDPELFHRLLSKQNNVPGGVLNMIGRVGGKKAVEDLIKPHNKNNLLSEMEDQIGRSQTDHRYMVSDDLRKVFANETGRLDFAFSRKVNPTAPPVPMSIKAASFLNTIKNPNDLANFQFSSDFIRNTGHLLNPHTIRNLRYGGRKEVADQYIRNIRSTFDGVREKLAKKLGRGSASEVTADELRDGILKGDGIRTFYRRNSTLVNYVIDNYYRERT
jgi:hypothetical protein